MGFPLVPKSVILNDLERLNSGWRNIDTFCGKNVDQKIKFLVIYHLRRYWQGIAPSESVLPSRHRKLDHNLDTVQDRR